MPVPADRLLGRVSAVDQFGSFLLLPLSFAFGGLVVQAVRPELVLVGAGVAGVALAAVGLLTPGLHDWRPLAEVEPAERRATGTEGP
jgi:hypothetical protein